MMIAKRTESFPRPVEELEALAAYYDTHDTASEMEDGEWVDPRPMKTASLRLPSDVLEALKSIAQARGMRYTAFIREIIEQVVSGARVAEHVELARINQRLERIEKVVTEQPMASDPQIRSRKRAVAKVRQQDLARRTLARAQASKGRSAKAISKAGRRLGR